MKKLILFAAAIMVFCVCMQYITGGFSSGSKNVLSDKTVTEQNETSGQTQTVSPGHYMAAQQAYADVRAKYDIYKDYYDCVKFYQSIGADIKLNDEYRNAVNQLPHARRNYEIAYNAFKTTFPDFASEW